MAVLRLSAVVVGLVVAATWHWVAGLVVAAALLYWGSWLARPVRTIPKRKVDRDLSAQHAALRQTLAATGDAPAASLAVRRPWTNEGELTMPYEEAYLVLTRSRLRMYKGNLYGQPIEPEEFEAEILLSRLESIEELTTFEEFASSFPDLDHYHQMAIGQEVQRAPIWVIKAKDPVWREPMAEAWMKVLLLAPAYIRGVTPEQAQSFLTMIRESVSATRPSVESEPNEGPAD